MNILEIKRQMKEKGMSQIELSEISKIPLQTIRKIFSGITTSPRVDTMEAILKALDIKQNDPSKTDKSNEITFSDEKLSPDECKLVFLYRKISNKNKAKVLSYAEGVENADVDKKYGN